MNSFELTGVVSFFVMVVLLAGLAKSCDATQTEARARFLTACVASRPPLECEAAWTARSR